MGVLLAEELVAAGTPVAMPCGGRGRCGKCVVYAAGDVLPPDALESRLLARTRGAEVAGYERRLACLAEAVGPHEVLRPEEAAAVAARPESGPAPHDGAVSGPCGIAIDVGTTTVTVLVFRLDSGEALADATQMNRQAVHGADVLSRIGAASRVGVPALQSLVVGQIREMLDGALARAGVPGRQVERCCATGNTTMLHLLTGRAVESMGVAPFTPESLFGFAVPAAGLFPALPRAELFLPPAVSAWVGPDIVCGLVATSLGAGGSAELLVDVGTNGEMVLARGNRSWCCSTAAGPAFEGAEISCGMPALPGAIDAVWPERDGLRFSTIGGLPPRGICGTGLIGAVDASLALGWVDGTGAMAGGRVDIGGSGVWLTAEDVRKLQLAKAAIAAGIDALLDAAGMAVDDVAVLRLAGGFGSYLQPGPAARIGLIPEALAGRAVPAGNTALAGAAMLAASGQARAAAKRWADTADEVELATNRLFAEGYIEHMGFGR
jgi:uncharacterized 2Fe-2S/4Fe-4S cluster protein (DUF4445 family)